MSKAPVYPKRLIEVDLPIKKISAHARREKSMGTITSLHLWWARRPLAACRAVAMATLWPDPADPLCSSTFRVEAAKQMRQFHERRKGQWTEPSNPEALREMLLDFIAEFSNPDVSNDSFLGSVAAALTGASQEPDGYSSVPLIVDPFAGGGSIPVEALRIGAEVFASDLNPVAALLNQVLVSFVPKFGTKLFEVVEHAGRWVGEVAGSRLSAFYPRDQDGGRPIAYLWARTVLSEAPSTGEYPIEIPLIRSMWLAKGGRASQAYRWVRDRAGKVITDCVEMKYTDGSLIRVLRPRLEIFEPRPSSKIEPGTCANASATCPVTGFTTPKASVRAQLSKRQGGTNDARLLCVVTTRSDIPGRFFRSPTDGDVDAFAAATAELEARVRAGSNGFSVVPDEVMPTGKVWKNNPFRTHLYGMINWRDLFNARQTLALVTLVDALHDLPKAKPFSEVSPELLSVVQAVLALSISREADHLNSGCAWNPSGPKLQHLFQRQAVSMIWDFGEANPFGGSVGDWGSMVAGALTGLKAVGQNTKIGQVARASATAHPLPDDVADAFITDPPYYDSVPYADLSEFFYIWLKRAVPNSLRDWFATRVIDREQECVYDENRGKDRDFYVNTMQKALVEGRRVLKPDGIGVVVFAHKSTSGWEALLQAIIDAGWSITASWPIDTELATRTRALKSAALGSSVHIVCRPLHTSVSDRRDESVGDWRNVLDELPWRIHDWMPRLAAEGVVGADAIFACLGPALEIFSRYSRVERASGEPVRLREFLEHVWAAVAKEALAMIFTDADATGFEEDARLTAMWLWTLSTGSANGNGAAEAEGDEASEDDEDGTAGKSNIKGFVLEYDAARKIAQGLGAHLEALSTLIEVKGSSARLLPVAERTCSLFQKGEAASSAGGRKTKKKTDQLSMGFVVDLEEAEESGGWGDTGAPQSGETVLDRVHQSMILFGAGRGEALKRFLVDDGVGRDGRFWRLAQAFSALYPLSTDEKRWVDGVLARKKSLGL
jgi:putative DNA methylase